MNYENDMYIDPDALDVEWLQQTNLAMRYGREWAEAKKEVSLAEENIKVIKSKLMNQANQDPKKYLKTEKATGPLLESYYRNHPEHQEVKEELIKLQYELDLIEIAKNEISFTRKSALENLVTLHGQQYFAGPSVPRNLGYEWEQKMKSKEANKKVKIKRRK